MFLIGDKSIISCPFFILSKASHILWIRPAKLHKAIDDHTLKAYGFSPTDDLLEKLLNLNLELAEKEKQGEAVIGPWAPDNPPKL